jgi:hypothetical protein
MKESTITKTLRVLGIHVAGAQTRKSAVVRGSFSIESIHTGLEAGNGHERAASFLRNTIKNIAIYPDQSPEPAPFFWEALATEIGPSATQDADTRLLETVASMDTVDIICIDAPLTLPPCAASSCQACSGSNDCNHIQTKLMQREWEQRREQGERKMRPPQPYLDRYFEYYARSRFSHPALSHCFEFDAALGSGRAPLTMRGQFLLKSLRAHSPNALILETNTVATTLGHALASGFQGASPSNLRSELEHRVNRLAVLKRLDQRKIAFRGAGLHEQAYLEIGERFETFSAAMSALTARTLLAGQVFITEELLQLDEHNPFRGWACLPREITDYAWRL